MKNFLLMAFGFVIGFFFAVGLWLIFLEMFETGIGL